MNAQRAHPGRPRLVPPTTTASPHDQVLHAAAELFVTKGFAATSTREIAERVGIRQASLYYHFTGKDEILAELLQRSVRPAVDKVEEIEKLAATETDETALYALALVDVHTLAEAPHNVGMLATLPDVTSSGAYDAFRSTRVELAEAYGRLAARVATPGTSETPEPRHLGEMLMHLVEVVTSLRGIGATIDPATADAIAATCLRACGVSGGRISAAAASAAALVRRMPASAYSRTASP
ncbi:TetR family transcriptional regulator [Nocardioides albertanoniae]|uniref:TetR family transcriptional regulator n=1 Tax=Nocardioides albertanoniae TaxID=1175486 RepID=A0A543A2W4_9ACTN|nr:TetR/AcrR family transcriptional regulator [Nocardioides albertanoniae]TQL66920.1 TetR family transcriptional regulator [Nocardioides albertanoniae]